MASYRITVPAREDISGIWDYLDEVSNARVADRHIDRFYQTFELLSQHPYMGVARRLAPELRSYPVPTTQYVIYYFPAEYGVRIARVAHGRRNITSRDIQPSEES